MIGSVIASGVLALAAAGRAAFQEPPGAPDGLRPALGPLEDLTGQELAFAEIVLERDAYLLHEPFTLRLRFGLASEFLATSMVQLFQRELDVPVQITAPWLETLDGLEALDGAAPIDAEPTAGPSIALGERIVRATPLADAELGGKTFRVFELARTYAAMRTGTLDLAAPLVRFAFATRFEDDFLQGRRALDRRDALVRGGARSIAIRALPEDGRPPEFSGAIGRFTVEARAEPDRLTLGENLALTLRIEGRSAACDLTHAEAPRLDGLADFHVRGSLVVERTPRSLTVRYDVVPLASGAIEVPPIRFAYFDTTPPARYVTVETQAVPLVVEVPAAPAPVAGAPEPAPAPTGRRTALLVVGFFVAVLGLLAVRRRARRA